MARGFPTTPFTQGTKKGVKRHTTSQGVSTFSAGIKVVLTKEKKMGGGATAIPACNAGQITTKSLNPLLMPPPPCPVGTWPMRPSAVAQLATDANNSGSKQQPGISPSMGTLTRFMNGLEDTHPPKR